MQAARNMFLTLDKTWRRKLAEFFVTYRMEHEFTKQQILSLYLNVIFFGQRSYGVAAAAEAYFGKSPGPARRRRGRDARRHSAGALALQPDHQPAGRRRARRTYVLRRMRELGYIDAGDGRSAPTRSPSRRRTTRRCTTSRRPYVAEMARLELRRRFGAEAENAGYRVYTTIDGRLQTAANRAVRIGLIEYDRRHG